MTVRSYFREICDEEKGSLYAGDTNEQVRVSSERELGWLGQPVVGGGGSFFFEKKKP